MVQVLPAVPTFGEKLVETLGGAGSNIAQGLQRRQAQTALQNLLTRKTPSGTPGTSQINQFQNIPSETPQSPLEQVLSQPGGPGFSDVLAFSQVAENAFPGMGGKIAADYFGNQQKIAGKEASQIKLQNLERQSKTVQKDVEKNIGRRETILKRRNEINRGLQAVRTGNVGGFDKNFLATLLGPAGEPIKSLEGKALESVTKNLLIDSLKEISGRPNQFLETQFKSALPGIGTKVEANEALFKMALADVEVEEKLINAKDELLSQYEKSGITPPSNLDKLANDIVKPYAQQIEDKLSYDIRVLQERSRGPSYLLSLEKVPQGTPLTYERRDALLKKYKGDKEKVKKLVKGLGYSIPSENALPKPTEQEQQIVPEGI